MKPNFTDERGTITDLIQGDNHSVTHITFNKGAIRGNHYHEHTDQKDLVLKGKLRVVLKKNFFTKEDMIMKCGDSVFIPQGIKHAYEALEDSEIISICFGERIGTNYEKDVIRLKKPLI